MQQSTPVPPAPVDPRHTVDQYATANERPVVDAHPTLDSHPTAEQRPAAGPRPTPRPMDVRPAPRPPQTRAAAHPQHPRRARHWSRRQGVVTVFAGFAVVAFGVAYLGPLGASLATRANAETNPPATIYSITRADAQSLDTEGHAAQAGLQRDKYTVKVIPKVAPPTTSTSNVTAQLASTFAAPSPGTAQAIAYTLVKAHGWDDSQFQCLVALWNRESGWRVNAANPSGAYGIPQSLPGSKMAAFGSDWATNPATQIKWGLSYITGSYGTPCAAWGHSNATGWY
jgi:hypothetical protein